MQVGSKAKLAMKAAIKDMQDAIVRKEVYDSRRRQELLQQGLSLEEVCALLLLYYFFTTAQGAGKSCSSRASRLRRCVL